MMDGDEKAQMGNFEDALHELIDRYLGEGMPVENVRSVLLHNTDKSLEARRAEIAKGDG